MKLGDGRGYPYKARSQTGNEIVDYVEVVGVTELDEDGTMCDHFNSKNFTIHALLPTWRDGDSSHGLRGA